MKKALICLDVQDDFLGKRLDYIKTLCQKYLNEHGREYDVVILTHWVYEDLKGQNNLLLSYPQAQIIAKETYSGLTDEVQAIFEQSGIEEVHIAGVHAELSVIATMFSCLDAGFETKILEPLTAAYHGLGWDAMRIARVAIGNENVLQIGGGRVYT